MNLDAYTRLLRINDSRATRISEIEIFPSAICDTRSLAGFQRTENVFHVFFITLNHLVGRSRLGEVQVPRLNIPPGLETSVTSG